MPLGRLVLMIDGGHAGNDRGAVLPDVVLTRLDRILRTRTSLLARADRSAAR